MRLSGRRLTLVLSTLLAVVLVAGATAAWSFGRHRADPLASVTSYQSGPTRDHQVALSVDAQGHPRSGEIKIRCGGKIADSQTYGRGRCLAKTIDYGSQHGIGINVDYGCLGPKYDRTRQRLIFGMASHVGITVGAWNTAEKRYVRARGADEQQHNGG